MDEHGVSRALYEEAATAAPSGAGPLSAVELTAAGAGAAAAAATSMTGGNEAAPADTGSAATTSHRRASLNSLIDVSVRLQGSDVKEKAILHLEKQLGDHGATRFFATCKKGPRPFLEYMNTFCKRIHHPNASYLSAYSVFVTIALLYSIMSVRARAHVQAPRCPHLSSPRPLSTFLTICYVSLCLIGAFPDRSLLASRGVVVLVVVRHPRRFHFPH